MRLTFLIACALAAAVMQGGAVRAATVTVLSAAAVEPGLQPVADLFARGEGDRLQIEYATGPEIRARIEAGETPDVIIAPEPVISALRDRLEAAVPLGSVGVGVAVRVGAKRPDISDVEALKSAMREAAVVVFSRGSSGVYVDGLIKRLDLDGAVRVERVANGGEVVARLARGSGDEIGLSALTELTLGRKQGVVVVGPLPSAVQNETAYTAAPLARRAARPEVRRFMSLLAGAETRALMQAGGLRVATGGASR